jgi:hypothetical protein
MFKPKKPDIKVLMPSAALEAIFDECDGFDVDETGGRLIGCYRNKWNKYEIEVMGIIDPGPKARRSPTSFFQDGEYQEQIFRSLEEKNPDIEHLGNWHTHHVNGYPTLSSGDQTTYQKIVNHRLHNTGFFYAILVVQKTDDQSRYKIKHFLFKKNDPNFYEIPDESIQITDSPIIWPLPVKMPSKCQLQSIEQTEANPERAKDQNFFLEHYPQFKPLFSKSLHALYWKGKLELIDGDFANVILIETKENGRIVYSATVSDHDLSLDFTSRSFKTAREAILRIEKEMNKNIFSRRLK